MNKWAAVAAVFGMLGVVIGAFGAHGIKPQITQASYEQYQTGVLYHFLHAIILFVVAINLQGQSRLITIVKWSLTLGILCFSGSLYLIATKELTGLSTSILGPITPVGGLFFILAWVLLAYYFFKPKIN